MMKGRFKAATGDQSSSEVRRAWRGPRGVVARPCTSTFEEYKWCRNRVGLYSPRSLAHVNPDIPSAAYSSPSSVARSTTTRGS